MNNVSLKSFIEFYAFVPLVLLALSATYKFGYFNALNAIWVLPSLNVQGFVYSILIIALLFLAGSALASFYSAIVPFFSHVALISVIFVITAVSCLIFGNIDFIWKVLSSSIPFFFGLFYFFYFKDVLDGDAISRSFSVFTFLIFSFMALFLMFTLGGADARRDIGEKLLPKVDFKDSTLNGLPDWRLLEASGASLILINLNTRNSDARFEFKVIEANKVDLIH